MFLRRRFSLSKNLPSTPINVYNKDDGGIEMESWRRDARREPVIADLDMLVPKDHLLRKIERVMGYQRLYERLEPYYCHDNGRPGTDPVVLIRMVLIFPFYSCNCRPYICQFPGFQLLITGVL